MKILYDHQAFDMQSHGGVSNCFVRLISNFPDDVKYELSLLECDNVHLKESHLLDIPPMAQPPRTFLYKKHFYGQGTLYDLFSKCFPRKTSLGRNRLFSIEKLKEGNFDVFHPTFFDDYFLDYLGEKPFVLTIHDMIAELFSNSVNSHILKKRRLALAADHIIAVSNQTKEDILKYLDVPDNKVSVIYHGAPTINLVKNENAIVGGKYILYVGERTGYKSFIPMLRELTPFLQKDKSLRVVCTGKSFTNCEYSFFVKQNIQDQMIHIAPSDSGMTNLYAHALCFIYPSMYEGFGIPILEAYKADCPVLLNRQSCFPEIAQDAAIYFALDSNGSNLAEVMEAFLLMNDSQLKCLIDIQRDRLKFFSWEKSAQQLCKIYGEII